MNFGEKLEVDVNTGVVCGRDTQRVVATFSHIDEAESFVEYFNTEVNINERHEFEKFMYGEEGHELNSKINSAEMSANYFAWMVWQARAYFGTVKAKNVTV